MAKQGPPARKKTPSLVKPTDDAHRETPPDDDSPLQNMPTIAEAQAGTNVREKKTRTRHANYRELFEPDFIRLIVKPRLQYTIKQHGAPESIAQLTKWFETDHSISGGKPLFVGVQVMSDWLKKLGYSMERRVVFVATNAPVAEQNGSVDSPSRPSQPAGVSLPHDEEAVAFDNVTARDTGGRLDPDLFGRLG